MSKCTPDNIYHNYIICKYRVNDDNFITCLQKTLEDLAIIPIGLTTKPTLKTANQENVKTVVTPVQEENIESDNEDLSIKLI